MGWGFAKFLGGLGSSFVRCRAKRRGIPKAAPGFVLSLGPFLAMTILVSGCYQNALTRLDRFVSSPPPSAKTVTVNFCLDPAITEQSVLKYLFIIDHSGSNKLNYKMNSDGTPKVENNLVAMGFATDPYGTLRYGTTTLEGSLLHFLDNLPANPSPPAQANRFFAAILFNGGLYRNSESFTSDTVAFKNQMQVYATEDTYNGSPSPKDLGATNYLMALDKASELLVEDINIAKNNANLSSIKVASTYVIVFISDGLPITVTGLSQNGVVQGNLTTTTQSRNDILNKVRAIKNLTAEREYVAGINFHSVYYFHADNKAAAAETLLADMAETGNGISFSQVAGSSIDYRRFQPSSSRRLKYLLSDILVTNVSGTWTPSGEFVRDADGDGVSDIDETAEGTNSGQRDTNSNGINDLVQKRVSPLPAPLPTPCNPPVQDAGHDGLNACEKILLGNPPNLRQPDSNMDGLPDWLAFKNGVPFQFGTPPAYSTSESDGYNHYQKVKFSLPVGIPSTQIKGFHGSNYDLLQVDNNISRACYRLNVTHLPFVTDTDKIRVDIFERLESRNDTPYRTIEKHFPSGGRQLIINDWHSGSSDQSNWRSWP